MAYHAQLDDELVYQFLRKRLIDFSVSQIVFNEYIEERRYVTQ